MIRSPRSLGLRAAIASNFFAAIAREAGPRLGEFSAQGLENLRWAFETAGVDAPELLDDYYLNLLDWSSTNILGVALGPSVYCWNAADGSIDQLMEMDPEGNQHVTALSWIEQGNYMAIGTSDHKVQIWDVEKHKQVRSMDGHSARVGALSWNCLLYTSPSPRDRTRSRMPSSA